MLYAPYVGGAFMPTAALNIGGGAMSTMFRVCPYFFCNSGSDAEV